MSNGSGTVVSQQLFDPYGAPNYLLSTNSPDFGYAGMFAHQRSGLNFARYRVYQPGEAKWLSRDSLQESAGINLFAYVGNNPVSFVDPAGLFRTTVTDTVTQILTDAGEGGAGSLTTESTGASLITAESAGGFGLAGAATVGTAAFASLFFLYMMHRQQLYVDCLEAAMAEFRKCMNQDTTPGPFPLQCHPRFRPVAVGKKSRNCYQEYLDSIDFCKQEFGPRGRWSIHAL